MKIAKPLIPKVLNTDIDATNALEENDAIEGGLIKGYVFIAGDLDKKNLNESLFISTRLSSITATKLDILDCEFKAADFTASKFPDANWMRVAVETSRCTGLQIVDGILRNVSFSDSKMDLVNFRTSKLENVLFENCVLSDVDFNDGNLKNVTFINCSLNDVTFNNAKMLNVDVSRSTIEHIKGVASLKGLTISEDQMLLLAPSLVAGAGMKLVGSAHAE